MDAVGGIAHQRTAITNVIDGMALPQWEYGALRNPLDGWGFGVEGAVHCKDKVGIVTSLQGFPTTVIQGPDN